MSRLFVSRTLGVLLLLFSTTIVPPLLLSILMADGHSVDFAITLLATLLLGLALWAPTRKREAKMRTRDGFLIVGLMWCGMSLLGVIPFMTSLDMSFVDSLFESASGFTTTLSTGGYSTHDASFAYFDSAAINSVAVTFMLLGGISFSVHFLVWRQIGPGFYLRDSQTRTFVSIVLLATAIVTVQLAATGTAESPLKALEIGAFEVVSVITSTGYGVTDFALWPLDLPVLLIFLSFIGGCAGSSSGGIKVIRFLILGKQARSHVRRLIHPRSMNPIRVDRRVVDAAVIEGIWGFFMVYIAIFATFMLILTLDGMDQVTAFGAVATCLNNLGPGLGEVSQNFTSVSDGGKLLLVLAMLFGRLEIFTILVLMTPGFWRS